MSEGKPVKCGCDCKICWRDTQNVRDELLPAEAYCPGPCPHTDEERRTGIATEDQASEQSVIARAEP